MFFQKIMKKVNEKKSFKIRFILRVSLKKFKIKKIIREVYKKR